MVAIAFALLMGADSTPIKVSKEYSRQELPFERINGISVSGSKWIVGSMRGLYMGTPGSQWKKISDQSIRQVITNKGEAWALYGNGSVDKLDIKNNRLYYDVLHGAVKRPWVGSISTIGEKTCFGGSGGWFEKLGEKSLSESYPAVLSGKHVTSVAGHATDRMLGTQDGLFVSNGRDVKRLGFGNGLADVWITAIVPKEKSLFVGTYTGGLYAYHEGKLQQIDTPSKKIRNLLVWRNQVVVGTLEGSWIQEGKSWTPLTKGETTFLTVVDNCLFVGTPVGVTSFG